MKVKITKRGLWFTAGMALMASSYALEGWPALVVVLVACYCAYRLHKLN